MIHAVIIPDPNVIACPVVAHLLVLGKFGPRPIGTQSGPDQTQQSQSGIFPKTWDRLVSHLGNSILPEMVADPVWTGTA